MNVSRSILLEQNGNSVNINGVNSEIIVKEIIDFMMDDFEKEYRRYKEFGGLYKIPKLNTSLILYLDEQKKRITKMVDKEDMNKVLGIRDIEFFNK